MIGSRRAEFDAGTALPMVLAGADSISIARGAFQNAHLGYWINRRAQGSGLMPAAVGATMKIVKDVRGLYLIEAATLVHNTASQRVLEKNGFESYGTARDYLQIAGQWQDHRMSLRILRTAAALPAPAEVPLSLTSGAFPK